MEAVSTMTAPLNLSSNAVDIPVNIYQEQDLAYTGFVPVSLPYHYEDVESPTTTKPKR